MNAAGQQNSIETRSASRKRNWILQTIVMMVLACICVTAAAQQLPPTAVSRLGKSGDTDVTHSVAATTFSPDGKLAATRSSDQIIRIYEVATGKRLQELPEIPGGGSIKDFTFSHDSKHIAAAIRESNKPKLWSTAIWSVATGKPVPSPDRASTYLVHRTATPDVLAFYTKSTVVHVKASQPDKVISTRSLINTGAQSEPESVSHDGKQLLVRNFPSGTHRLVSVSLEGGPVRELYEFRRAINHAAWSPNGRDIVATCYGDRRVYFRDSTNPAFNIELAVHEAPVQAAAFSPDGRHLLSADTEGNLRIWDMSRKQVLCKFKDADSRRLVSVNFSPDGRYVSTSSGGKRDADNSAIIWDWKKLLLANIQSADSDNSAWDLLASTTPRVAYAGIKQLVEDPDASTKLLFEKFGGEKESLTREQIAQYIERLNAADFATRQAAEKKLSRVRISAAEQLQAALDSGTQPVETEVRLRKLLTKASDSDAINNNETRQLLRAVYVLELIESNAARSLLQSIANNHPFDTVRNSAAAAIKRLGPAAIH